eukprot:UN14924
MLCVSEYRIHLLFVIDKVNSDIKSKIEKLNWEVNAEIKT